MTSEEGVGPSRTKAGSFVVGVFMFLLVGSIMFPAIFSTPLVDSEEKRQYEEVCNEKLGVQWDYRGLAGQVNESHTRIECYKDLGWGGTTEEVVTEDIHGGREGKSLFDRLWDNSSIGERDAF